MSKTNYRIGKIYLHHIFALKNLFDQALKIDFNYFPDDYLDIAKQQNSILSLLRGVLSKKRLMLGVWQNHHLVGYVIGDKTNQSLGQIFWLFVSPSCRRNGLGEGLLTKALEDFRSFNIDRVTLVTHLHKDYYLRYGFKIDKLVPKMIGNIDMYLMSIKLKKNARKIKK